MGASGGAPSYSPNTETRQRRRQFLGPKVILQSNRQQHKQLTGLVSELPGLRSLHQCVQMNHLTVSVTTARRSRGIEGSDLAQS